jgi:hypothetical protein
VKYFMHHTKLRFDDWSIKLWLFYEFAALFSFAIAMQAHMGVAKSYTAISNDD